MIRQIDVITGKETTRNETSPKVDERPEIIKQNRIAELKQLLRDTDYVALSDYDKDKTDIIAQRAKWRKEIRQLEDD